MRKVILTFGLLGGGVLAAMMLATIPLQDEIGFDRGAIIGYTTMVLAFLMVYFGVRSYRDNVAGGALTFGQAFKVGILITAVITVCYVVTWEVIFYTLMPDFGEKYTAFAIEKSRLAGASDAHLAQQAKDLAAFMTMYRNPLVNIAFSLLEPLPVGVVFTLVTAGVLGRKRGADRAAA
jgi:hypothetical protein